VIAARAASVPRLIFDPETTRAGLASHFRGFKTALITGTPCSTRDLLERIGHRSREVLSVVRFSLKNHTQSLEWRPLFSGEQVLGLQPGFRMRQERDAKKRLQQGESDFNSLVA
jgi:hypothetical protein